MFSEGIINRSNLDVEIADPFFIFEKRNIFSEKYYNELEKQFPEKILFLKIHEIRGKNSYLDSKMPQFFEFIDKAPSWAELYEYFCKPTVISSFFGLTRTVESERPKSQTNEWRLVVDPRRTVALSRVERLITGLNGKI